MTDSRNILITGASRGLGLALARELARAGWRLIITARGEAALESARAELAAHTRVIAMPGDVADDAHRRRIAAAAAELGGLDAVVNNASLLGVSPLPNLLDYPLDALAEVFRVNTLAPLAVLQAARPHLRPQARIINVSSDAGVEAYPGWGGYGASKAALEQLSAVLAEENPGWRVYWVDPGDMRTEMHQAAFPGEDISDRPLPDTAVPGFIALLTGDYPGGRYRAQQFEAAPPAGVQELRVALTVDDLDEAVDVYRRGLGLPLIDQWISDEGRGVLLGAGRATLELIDADQAGLIDRVEVGQRVAGTVRLAFEVGDLHASTAALARTGAMPLNGPVDTPWGDRNQRLRSPDGMQVTLFQLPAES